jgi:hypothetical protein
MEERRRQQVHSFSCRTIVVIVTAVIIYLATGGALWFGGGYILDQTGSTRRLYGIETRISVPDVVQWQPLWGHFQSSYTWPGGASSPRCSIVGWLFYPVFAFFDRQTPIYRLIDTSGNPVPHASIPEGVRMHPSAKNR